MIRPMALCALLLCALPGAGQAQSAFGCSDLDGLRRFAAVEGQGGTFYRLHPDLHMFHPFADHTADQVAAFSQALASKGTTLIYVPLPTKSLAMPAQLPQAARDYGFDVDTATTVYYEALKKLKKRGVVAVDVLGPLRAGTGDAPSFFLTDPRLTAAGAEREARAIADAIAQIPEFAALPKARFEAGPSGTATLESVMRTALQRNCLQALPLAQTETFATTRLQSGGAAADNAIFGAGTGQARIAVVGTAIDGDPAVNLAGFLSQQTGLETVHYALPEGGAFGAISSYLTSRGFQDARPAYLVWSVPVSDSLADFGDQPLVELAAAVGDTCRIPLPLLLNPQTGSVLADLATLDPGQPYTLFLDADSTAAGNAQFHFTHSGGQLRTKSIHRHEDQVKTGRFYMPMTGLWPEGAQTVEIRLDAPFGSSARVMACFD